jgi:hypothetical protein
VDVAGNTAFPLDGSVSWREVYITIGVLLMSSLVQMGHDRPTSVQSAIGDATIFAGLLTTKVTKNTKDTETSSSAARHA